MPAMDHTWTELDRDALRGNIAALRDALTPGAAILFVVKSDAYGHGLERVAECAWREGVRWFDVAHVAEGVALRACLPEARILVSGAILGSEVPAVCRAGLAPIVVSEAHATAVSDAALRCEAVLRCHAMVDTGMGRLGFDWQTAPDAVARVADLPGLRLAGVCSHFASADAPERGVANEQAGRFAQVLASCEERGLDPAVRHIANSAALLLERAWDYDLVRSGIHLYGYAARPSTEGAGTRRHAIRTRPVLSWKTRVVQVRSVPSGFPVSYDSTYVTHTPTRLAVLDVGYADGYNRTISNRGCVLLGGRRCPVVGRVTMNLTVVDVGMDGEVSVGDEAVLIGRQGDEAIWADEIAGWCETIPYEVLTWIRAGSALPCSAQATCPTPER